MIKELIKLANQLDQIGLDRYSDKIDGTISRLQKEAQGAYLDTPTPGSTSTQLGMDLARVVAPVVTGPFESAYNFSQGKEWSDIMPSGLRSVESYMERKQHYIDISRASLDSDAEASVKEESTKLSASALKGKIKKEVESMFFGFGGTFSQPNFYRNMDTICPRIYQLAWAIGFKGEPKPGKGEIGLDFVNENLSSRTTSWTNTDYRDAGYWIMLKVVEQGWVDGVEARKKAAQTPPAVEPQPGPAPRPRPGPPTPDVDHHRDSPNQIVLIRHEKGTVLSDLHYTYEIVNQLEFKWFRRSDNKTGNFSLRPGNTEQWNEAATKINLLEPVKSGEGRGGEVTTQPGLTAPVAPSADNSLNNVEIILARINAGATFAIGTFQNEMARLRRLIEGGMSIPDIAREIVRQNSIALTKSSLASAKPDDLNKMSNGDIKRAYRTEVDLIMSTINRIFKAQK